MGTGTHQLESPAKLQHEVEEIRGNMDSIVSELDHRRHDVLDWRLQLQKHWVALSCVAGGVLLFAGTMIGLGIWNRQRLKRPTVRARKIKEALVRIYRDPDHVAKPSPNIANKVLAAMASTAASAAVGAVIKATVPKLIDPAKHDEALAVPLAQGS
jgi:hypothetical protein